MSIAQELLLTLGLEPRHFGFEVYTLDTRLGYPPLPNI